jgi:putative ABC transport system permease protein
MLSPRWRKVGRDLSLHKTRALLAVLAIAFGILGAGSVLDTWALLRQVTTEEFRRSNPPSAILHTEGIDRALLTRVRALPAIAAAQARRVVIGSVRVNGAWEAAVLFRYQDFAAIPIGVIKAEAGSWPPADGSIVIERSSLGYAQTRLGSTLLLQVGNQAPVTLPVAGVARDVGQAPGWMDHVVYGFVTEATLAQLGAPAALDQLEIVVARNRLDREAVRRVAHEVERVVEATGRRVAGVEVPVPGRHVHAAQMESLLFTQEAFGLLALVLSGLLVINLITAMLSGQVREVGVMKVLGARDGQIDGMYFGFALVLGLTACALGVPGAALLGRAYARFSANLLNFDLGGARLPVSIVLVELAVGALLPILAAAVPILRACRIPVGEALRDCGVATREGVPPRVLARAGFLARPLLFSLRNSCRRRQRLALTVLTVATGGAVYLGAINLRAAIGCSVDALFAARHYDMSLKLGRPYPAAAVEAAAARVPGVRSAEAWAGARAVVSGADGTLGSAFPIIALPPGSRLLAPLVERGRWLPSGDPRALVVSRRLREDEPRLEIGRDVLLVIGGRPARCHVTGVVDAGPTLTAFAPRDVVAAAVAGGANVLAVAAVDGSLTAQRELLDRLRAALGNAGIEVESTHLVAPERQAVEDHLLMVAAFLGAMGQLIILVGGFGLASTMSLAVLERRREIGVLRAIGARHRTILAMIQVEALTIGLLGWLAALPLSVAMSVVLGNAFGRIMFRVPVTLLPQPGGVMRWALVAAAVSVAGASWPAWRATRVSTAAALAYE